MSPEGSPATPREDGRADDRGYLPARSVRQRDVPSGRGRGESHRWFPAIRCSSRHRGSGRVGRSRRMSNEEQRPHTKPLGRSRDREPALLLAWGRLPRRAASTVLSLAAVSEMLRTRHFATDSRHTTCCRSPALASHQRTPVGRPSPRGVRSRRCKSPAEIPRELARQGHGFEAVRPAPSADSPAQLTAVVT